MKNTAEFSKDYTIIKEHRKERNADVDLYGPKGDYIPKESPQHHRFYTFMCSFLSPRSTDKQVAETLKMLIANGYDLEKVCTADPATLESLLTVNNKKRKAGWLKEAAIKIRDEYGGDIPKSPKELQAFKGIGEKLSLAIIKFVWDECNGISVDTHVHRVSNRLGWANSENASQTRAQLEKIVPKADWSDLIMLVTGFGQQICQAKKPKCDECNLKPACSFYQQTLS